MGSLVRDIQALGLHIPRNIIIVEDTIKIIEPTPMDEITTFLGLLNPPFKIEVTGVPKLSQDIKLGEELNHYVLRILIPYLVRVNEMVFFDTKHLYENTNLIPEEYEEKHFHNLFKK